tara:strand:- start:541 stop:1401 length:861 start_codon:yes stop_codon:yes gene_type:complete
MKKIKYFIEYTFISLLFLICKFLGYEKGSNLGEKIGKKVGPLFRNKKIILENLNNAKINEKNFDIKNLINDMWGNYGRILCEYPFISSLSGTNNNKYLKVNGKEVLERLKKENKKAVFISGHFNNFELMAMQISKQGIDLAAIYRPLNNIFLNKKMENIRKKFICKNQIKKGIAGTREIIKFIKNGYSIALMIDQRVSEGIESKFFNKKAFTTTIPAQLHLKYGLEIVPVYIERKNKHYFTVYFYEPLSFDNNKDQIYITNKLNNVLENLILKNPSQWIWTHDRWK